MLLPVLFYDASSEYGKRDEQMDDAVIRKCLHADNFPFNVQVPYSAFLLKNC
jgi:hypothetical protein